MHFHFAFIPVAANPYIILFLEIVIFCARETVVMPLKHIHIGAFIIEV